VKHNAQLYVKECDCHKQWAERQEHARRFEEANVWDTEYTPSEDYRGTKSLDDLRALEKYVKDYERYKENVVYVYGPNGTQKTTLAMWAARQLMLRGYSVFYTLMSTLSVSLSPDFTVKDGRREAFVRKAVEADLLIVDEAFDRKTTTIYKSGYQIPFLTQFFKERVEVNKQGVLFISNVRTEDISTDFGPGLRSFAGRTTASSTLCFEDVFINSANKINPKGLFI